MGGAAGRARYAQQHLKLAQEFNPSFSDLAPETLAAMLKDCEAIAKAWGGSIAEHLATDASREAWAMRQEGRWIHASRCPHPRTPRRWPRVSAGGGVMRFLIPLAAAFLAGLVAGIAVAGGHAHARPAAHHAAWASLPCAAEITRAAIRYTCPIEEN